MNSKTEFYSRLFAFKNLRWICVFVVILGLFPLTTYANPTDTNTITEQQQSVTVSGVVMDQTGETLIGASVEEKGTTNGTVTNFDGEFSLAVSPNATLVVSYVGYLTQEIKLTPGTLIYQIILQDDAYSLDELVVVGYGVQKKKLITGANINLKGDDIAKQSTTSVLTAIQSRTPGVTIIQNNGQPGSGYIVNIRGVGTNGNASPLYVIDGVAGGDLNHISPSDIESIDILKDAASAAIYGSRGANGVVLVTTKQGKAGKLTITYDGYYGQQYMYKKPDLLNAREYMAVQDEIRFNEGNAPYDWAALLPANLYNSIMNGSWNGTDWVDEFYIEGAQTQQHSINLVGGGEVSKFSMGYSYTSQDGILGEAVQSEYTRGTFRINSDHVLLKVRDFDAIKIGQTLNYMYRTNGGISTGNQYWNAFHNVITANPLMPAYNETGDYYDQNDKNREGWTYDGGFSNPIASVAKSNQGQNFHKNYNLNASAYLEIQPIKGLLFKSLFGYKMSAYSGRDQNQKRYLSNNENVTTETVNQNQSSGYNWSLDNTITYLLREGDHNADIVAGQSVEKWGYGENVGSGGQNNIFDLGWDYAWVNNTKPTSLAQRSASGEPWGNGARASFFGRVYYNYKETYMASASLVADASSNFARGHRWGYFPAFSAGWIMTNESFMESARGVMDFFKLRASWGQNGNQSIGGFQYLSQYNFNDADRYYFGTDKSTPYTGASAGVLQNPEISWETQQMVDFGFDARFLKSRLGLEFSWYNRTTKDWLVVAPISSTWGYDAPNVNGGDITNKGIEVSLGWDDRVSDFTYGINFNYSYNKNEVTKINNTEKIIHGPGHVLSQSTSEMFRIQEGYPIGYFWGYKTAGVFQNWDEVNNTVAKLNGAQPGDVIFVDTNGDDMITDDDKTMIGDPNAKHRIGLNLNFAYKGFDLGISGSGVFDFEIAKSYRRFADSPNHNYTTDVFKRWTGEGTSNKYPRLLSGNHTNYMNISDLYIEKGDYFKIQNITLGYNFKQLFPKMPLGQARVYFSVQNLYTFTGYSGMDPEIGYGFDQSWAKNIDLGYYPSARTYLVGVNLTF